MFLNIILGQLKKVHDKIFKIIETIAALKRVPSNYLKYLTGTGVLYRVRFSLAQMSGECSTFLQGGISCFDEWISEDNSKNT